jgi:PAS domain S-box-containing protein
LSIISAPFYRPWTGGAKSCFVRPSWTNDFTLYRFEAHKLKRVALNRILTKKFDLFRRTKYTEVLFLDLGMQYPPPQFRTGQSSGWARWTLVALVLAGVSLAFDLIVPPGIGTAVSYLAVVLVGVWIPDRRCVFALAVGASVLVVLGMVLAQDPGPPAIAVANRGLAIAAIWGAALVIFERRRVQDVLTDSEARLNSILDNAVDGIVTIDEACCIRSFNRSAEAMFGYRRAEVLGLNVSILMMPGDATAHDGFVRRYLESGNSAIIGVGPREVEGRRRDGSTFPLELAVGELNDGGERLFVGALRDITLRKDVEDEAAEKSALLEAVFETMAQGFTVIDGDCRLMAFNQQYAALIGYPQGFLRIGMPLEEMIRFRAEQGHLGPGDTEALVRDRLEQFKTGSENATERRLPNGTTYLYHRKNLPRGGTVTTFTDLTEQKKAQEKISVQSALLEATFQTMSQGVAVFDSDLKLAAFNPQYAEILNYPLDFLRIGMDRHEIIRFRYERGELGAGKPDELIPAKTLESITPHRAERTLTNGRTLIYERRQLPKGGFISTATDITDRKRAEEQLAAQSTLLQATFDNMSQGIAVFDRNHILVTMNARYTEITGLPPDLVQPGVHRRDLIAWQVAQGRFANEGDDTEAIIAAHLAITNTLGSIERVAPDGTVYRVERKSSPQGGYITTISDVTEWRETEKKLHQAQKMEAVGQLTGGIAHDFNNLLAISLGNLELAIESLDQRGDVRAFLETAKGATERGAALTSQMMAFSRRQALQPEVIDARELTAELGDFIRRILSEAIELEMIRADDTWPVMVDRSQLQSAVLNLIVNARDAMPDGGRITVEIRNLELTATEVANQKGIEPGRYLELSVTDTGSGMTPEVLEHVFEPFFTTKGVGEGTGLGLSMVYGFAQQSGGFIDLESAPGEGTKVRILLPRYEVSARVEKDPTTDDPAAAAERETAVRGRILLVEDDADVRATAAAMLASAGYDVVATHDGPSALAAMAEPENRDIHLVLSDIVLTGPLNGVEVAERLLSEYPGLTVAFMTGYADLDTVSQSEMVSHCGLIRKPFTKARLAQFLDSVTKSEAA